MAASNRQTVLITGAGKRRIGSYVAEALAERGYAVAIHYRNSAAEAVETVARLHAAGAEAESFAADLGDAAAVRTMIDGVVDRFGRIDVLVNCAGLWQPKRLEETTADDVRRHFEVNTLGTFLCSQQAGLVMVRQPAGGVIVTIGDWACARPYLNYAGYFASKGTVPTMTRSLAVELAARNPRIRVNCILPGPVLLPPDMPPTEREQAINATLVRREGSPTNIARAVLHFIDNDFVTGVCLPVDGGRSIFSTDSLG